MNYFALNYLWYILFSISQNKCNLFWQQIRETENWLSLYNPDNWSGVAVSWLRCGVKWEEVEKVNITKLLYGKPISDFQYDKQSVSEAHLIEFCKDIQK